LYAGGRGDQAKRLAKAFPQRAADRFAAAAAPKKIFGDSLSTGNALKVNRISTHGFARWSARSKNAGRSPNDRLDG
jgi:hypothetical protein